MKKSTTPKVTLRYEQKTGSTVQNLYLDYYPPITNPETGKTTRREFLHMRVQPLLTSKGEPCSAKTGTFEIPHTGRYYVYDTTDSETIQTAALYAASRQQAMYRDGLLTDSEQRELMALKRGETPVLDYYTECIQKRNITANTERTWYISQRIFGLFLDSHYTRSIRLKDVDKTLCDKYLRYLQTAGTGRFGYTLKHNTVATYYSKFLAVIYDAHENGYIQWVPQVQHISMKETERVFLDLAELQRLAQTPCSQPAVKRAALFSALTGLRESDVIGLRWCNVMDTERGCEISITMQKTQQHIIVPISSDTLALCGTRGDGSDYVFADVHRYRSSINYTLGAWAKAAGIDKHITFHTFRHTYATLQLDSGTAITTIQQILGHKSLKTTQIYAKVLDSAKRAAADRIKIDIQL